MCTSARYVHKRCFPLNVTPTCSNGNDPHTVTRDILFSLWRIVVARGRGAGARLHIGMMLPQRQNIPQLKHSLPRTLLLHTFMTWTLARAFAMLCATTKRCSTCWWLFTNQLIWAPRSIMCHGMATIAAVAHPAGVGRFSWQFIDHQQHI